MQEKGNTYRSAAKGMGEIEGTMCISVPTFAVVADDALVVATVSYFVWIYVLNFCL